MKERKNGGIRKMCNIFPIPPDSWRRRNPMKTRLAMIVIFTMFVLLGALALGGVVHAQTGGGYDLSWFTIDSGGETFSSGGGYSLGGTIGQADAGAMHGGGYVLAGGFWPDTHIEAAYTFHLPLVSR
ncbi:MAG: hypothetical protein JW726_19680 [Anaerolineales bacterium]|nr:hypothetical protein [Anaerolineales bacterium]